MNGIATEKRVALKNLLFLTDFSEPSELAIPFAVALAREYQAKLHALHVLVPTPLAYASPETVGPAIEAMEEGAQAEMQRLDSQLVGVTHETIVVRDASIWSSIERTIRDRRIDLLIVGTHGRTGAAKLLLGSVAEDIFRRASIPVLTIGPSVRTGAHRGGHFHRVLFATDFSREAQAAAPYAISLAEEHQARLLLLHVMRDPVGRKSLPTKPESVANIMHELYEIVPPGAESWCRPEATVRFGIPADKILEAARELDADLIVLGVRDPGARIAAATHLERATAHRVVAHALCPVLTIRG